VSLIWCPNPFFLLETKVTSIYTLKWDCFFCFVCYDEIVGTVRLPITFLVPSKSSLQRRVHGLCFMAFRLKAKRYWILKFLWIKKIKNNFYFDFCCGNRAHRILVALINTTVHEGLCLGEFLWLFEVAISKNAKG